LENIQTIQQYFPDFSIYVYVGECDPSWTFPDGVNVIYTEKSGPINMLFRYKPITFADVGFVRDTDSRITERDRWCINKFLESSYSYHVIRDHTWHKSKIMGGMFGWKEKTSFTFDENHPSTYGYDEHILSEVLYPSIVPKLLVHTNVFGFIREHTERIEIPHKDEYDFIGNVYKNETPEFTYSIDIVEQVRRLQEQDQFSIIQYLTNDIDPLSIPYVDRAQFYDACFIANYYLRDVEKCQYWLSKYEFAEIIMHTITNANFLFGIMNKRIIATFDESREPTDDEIVIVYGSYPDWYLQLPSSRKLYRHVSLFKTIHHDVVEYAPEWEPVDKIYILNLEERHDRYCDILLSLVSVRAPLHRIHHYKAKSGDIHPYAGATKNHVDVVDDFCKSGLKNCLILEDDIVFIDKPSVLSALREFYSKPRDYNICFLSLSKIGRREPYDDLLGQTFQNCTTSSGYFLQSSTAQVVSSVLSEGFAKILETGDYHNYCVDRYWCRLLKLFYFRKKLGYQRPSYSNTTRKVTAHLD
jgi:hypothetical protein